jgi:hypothetical protein
VERERAQDAVISVLGGLGLTLASSSEIDEGHDLARRLIGPALAPVSRLRRAQAHSGACCFAFYEAFELTGIFAFLLLNAAGLGAVIQGDFQPGDPPLWALARATEPPAGYFGWAFAGSTRLARWTVVAGAARARRIALPSIPFFCHAATPAGRRAVIEKLGYVAYGGADAELLWSPPIQLALECAA